MAIDQHVKGMKIVTVALIMGVVVFLGVATFIKSDPDPNAGTPMMTYMAAGFALINLGVRAVMLTVIPKNQIQQQRQHITDSEEGRKRLAGIYQSRLIIGMALCEGSAFFAIIAWMSESNELALGVILFLVTVMIMSFPFRQRVLDWIDVKIFELNEDFRAEC
ncbi:MAG: hypothetical protein O2820_07610 [Planctomycetota bacterium]|nr:hypothetical protein [Planctomycetota bacterium]MDA1249078.1 hypothetical protein [Planctomycetota bacterium]